MTNPAHSQSVAAAVGQGVQVEVEEVVAQRHPGYDVRAKVVVTATRVERLIKAKIIVVLRYVTGTTPVAHAHSYAPGQNVYNRERKSDSTVYVSSLYRWP